MIDQVFESILYQEKLQVKSLRLRAIQILMLIINAMAEIGMNIEDKKMVGGNTFEEVFRSESLPAIKSVICQYIEAVCNLVNLEQVNKQNSIIDKINNYVEDNIKNSMSLNIISEEFHLNKSYLSRIY